MIGCIVSFSSNFVPTSLSLIFFLLILGVCFLFHFGSSMISERWDGIDDLSPTANRQHREGIAMSAEMLVNGVHRGRRTGQTRHDAGTNRSAKHGTRIQTNAAPRRPHGPLLYRYICCLTRRKKAGRCRVIFRVATHPVARLCSTLVTNLPATPPRHSTTLHYHDDDDEQQQQRRRRQMKITGRTIAAPAAAATMALLLLAYTRSSIAAARASPGRSLKSPGAGVHGTKAKVEGERGEGV